MVKWLERYAIKSTVIIHNHLTIILIPNMSHRREHNWGAPCRWWVPAAIGNRCERGCVPSRRRQVLAIFAVQLAFYIIFRTLVHWRWFGLLIVATGTVGSSYHSTQEHVISDMRAASCTFGRCGPFSYWLGGGDMPSHPGSYAYVNPGNSN